MKPVTVSTKRCGVVQLWEVTGVREFFESALTTPTGRRAISSRRPGWAERRGRTRRYRRDGYSQAYQRRSVTQRTHARMVAYRTVERQRPGVSVLLKG